MTNYVTIQILKKLNYKDINNFDLNIKDTSICQRCAFDSYNSKLYNFSNNEIKKGDEITKKKIEQFYKFFINNKQKFNLESLSLKIIKDDPEKFNTKYGF
jgi:hypothetical protein